MRAKILSRPPVDPYLKWMDNLGNPAWPPMAATTGSCRNTLTLLPCGAYAASLDDVFQVLADETTFQAAARRLYLSPQVRTLVDQGTSLANGFRTLWDLRVRLQDERPPQLESRMSAIQSLPWRDRLDSACFIRAAAKSARLVVGLDLPEATEDQRHVMTLVEILRKWSVLDHLPVGVLLGVGQPVRVHGLRKLLQTGVFPKYG